MARHRSTATSRSGMYSAQSRAFDGDISKWDVSRVVKMSVMFHGAASFNGDISKWDVFSAINRDVMFHGVASFNGDISKWDVSSANMDVGLSKHDASTLFNNLGALSDRRRVGGVRSSTKCDLHDLKHCIVTGKSVLRIGDGLEDGSITAYRREWALYIKFCTQDGVRRIPGRDVTWSIDVLARYLAWRSRRTKCIAQIKSRLKHCSLCRGHMLPTKEGEGPALLRLQLAMVTKVILKKRKERLKAAGKSTAVKRSLALGQVAVGMLFSAYGATTGQGFSALPDEIQAHLTRCPCMHTNGMRFGLMRDLRNKASMRWSDIDQAYRFASDWRKMKRGGAFTLPFAKSPRFEPMTYPAYNDNGVQTGTFTAADVLRWRAAVTKSHSGKRLFTSPGQVMDRAQFQNFLRTSFRRLLVGSVDEITALAAAITPHSFRAGMASDLQRLGVSVKTIMKIGRWESERAMKQYVRDGLAQRLASAKFFSIRKMASAIATAIRSA